VRQSLLVVLQHEYAAWPEPALPATAGTIASADDLSAGDPGDKRTVVRVELVVPEQAAVAAPGLMHPNCRDGAEAQLHSNRN